MKFCTEETVTSREIENPFVDFDSVLLSLYKMCPCWCGVCVCVFLGDQECVCLSDMGGTVLYEAHL